MNALVREWVDKAAGDVRTAEREGAVTDEPNWDAVCYHAQQAIEKYLKAVLQQQGAAVARTHDLAALLQLVTTAQVELSDLSDDAEWLTAFAVEVRYPGETADEEAAGKAIAVMRRMSERLRASLDSPGPEPADPAGSGDQEVDS